MLTDFALISILLLVAQMLRARVAWLGRWLVPTSILAGVLGLVGGPQLLGLLPFSVTQNSQGLPQLQLSQYPGVLIVFVFATLLMGHKPRTAATSGASPAVRSTLLFNVAAELGQFGLAILLGLFVIAPLFPDLPKQFAVMLPAGFAGGYGTAAIFGQPFVATGWEDALSVGFAFATMGMATAVVGGMALINLAARRGWTSIVRVGAVMPAETAAAFVEPPARTPLGEATVNPIALEPLAWHVALLLAVYGMASGIDLAIHRAIPGDYWLPLFAIAMLVGASLQGLLEIVGVGQYVDRTTIRRLGSLCADYLIAFGVASIKLSVVQDYAGPIVLLSVFGFLYSVGVLFLGAHVFRNFWFERSIFTYGWLTGVVGFSVALLRVVDPQMRSQTLEDYGKAYVLIGPIELALYPAIIWACGRDAYLALGIGLTALAGTLFMASRTWCADVPPALAAPLGSSAR